MVNEGLATGGMPHPNTVFPSEAPDDGDVVHSGAQIITEPSVLQEILGELRKLNETNQAILEAQVPMLHELEDFNASQDWEVTSVRVVSQAPGLAANEEFGWQEDDILAKMYAQGWKLADSWMYQACNSTKMFETGYFHHFKFERRRQGRLDPERWLTVPNAALYLKKPQRFILAVMKRPDELQLPSHLRENPVTDCEEPYIRMGDLVDWIESCLPHVDGKGARKVGD